MSESLRSVLLQEIKAKFPAIDWSLGSVVRELVIEPLAKLGDILESHISAAKSTLDVSTICGQPEMYEEELDAWISRLGIIPPSLELSTGTVRIMRTSPEDLTIVEGTQFSWNDKVLVYAVDTYNVTKDAKDGVTNNLTYKNYNDAAFSVDIPVRCSSYSAESLGSGAPLNWETAPSDVYDVHVGSTISGGFGFFGPQEKARMVLDAITPDAFSGESCIRKALRRNFPQLVCDVVVGPKDIKKPYAVSLYIKPVNSIREFEVPVMVLEGDAVINGCGVYRVNELFDASGNSIPFSVNYPEDLGCSDSKISMELQISVESGTGFVARVLGFPEYAELDGWLKGVSKSTPFTFNLKPPAVGIVKLFMVVDGSPEDVPASTISDLVSESSIDASLADSKFEQLLVNYTGKLTRPIIYSVDVLNKNNTQTYTMFKSVSPPALRYTTNTPLALYSQSNLVEITSA